ncbi:methylglyoxal synthase [Salinibius halmophilus]|uniref:methylglyoxal synthase n=1 Tax=Salinibius halmophilus TaxID=1853216 RepID=UPI000E665B16|nr:methylglyoxal synthase [Salinibius halmophilus]
MNKNVALVAHDNKKEELCLWAKKHEDKFSKLGIFATGTTGRLLEKRLGRPINRLLSGPLGGDQQIGAKIAEGEIHMLIFFWDPLEPQPHDPDIKALLRIAALWNVPVACNIASADYMIESPLLLDDNYQPTEPDFSIYTNRVTPAEGN